MATWAAIVAKPKAAPLANNAGPFSASAATFTPTPTTPAPTTAPARTSTLRSCTIDVPSNCKGAIIGKGGQNIQRMQEKHAVKIHVPRNDQDGKQDTKVTITITCEKGVRGRVLEAKEELVQLVKDITNKEKVKKPAIIEFDLDFKNGNFNRFFGDNDSNIRRIENILRANIYFDSNTGRVRVYSAAGSAGFQIDRDEARLIFKPFALNGCITFNY